MIVPDPDAFARLICDWCLEVSPRQQLLVAITTEAMGLMRSLHREILSRGAWPLLRLMPDQLGADFYRFARDIHLDSFAPLELAEMESADASLYVTAPTNTHAFAGIDPDRIVRVSRARIPVKEVRLSKRWCSTIWPTPGLAQAAGMGDDDYAAFVNRALFLDRPDPVAAWQELSDRQQRLVDRLNTANTIRIEADGTIRFTVPSSPRGLLVEDATLTFEQGQVVTATAARGQEYLDAALATDAGARFLGEIGIGTNAGIDRPTGSILLDEKMAGTVHLALGRSYPETGGRNQSSLHWDLICDLRAGGRLTADGEPIDLEE